MIIIMNSVDMNHMEKGMPWQNKDRETINPSESRTGPGTDTVHRGSNIKKKGDPMKVLLAEDIKVSRIFLEKILNYFKCDVISCSNGLMAWNALKNMDKPDMAILDWEMPGLTGLELCERIRNDPELDSIYVIILTARERKEDMMKGYEIGVDDYLSKPVTLDDLKWSILKGKKLLREKPEFGQRQENIYENLYEFMERKGEFREGSIGSIDVSKTGE